MNLAQPRKRVILTKAVELCEEGDWSHTYDRKEDEKVEGDGFPIPYPAESIRNLVVFGNATEDEVFRCQFVVVKVLCDGGFKFEFCRVLTVTRFLNKFPAV